MKFLHELLCITYLVVMYFCIVSGCGLKSPPISEESNPESNRLRRQVDIEIARQFASAFIVGGSDASWPWMVGLFRKTKSDRKFFCGASLISHDYVLTAAHCFEYDVDKDNNVDASGFSVFIGSDKLKKGSEYDIDHITIHPKYQEGEYYNDIALLKLEKPVTYTEKIYPVCLPSDDLMDEMKPSTNDVTVTGWGYTSKGGNSQTLQEVNLSIVPQKECNDSYFKYINFFMKEGINNQLICAGSKEKNKDACQNDSGGPLVAKLTNSSWVQLGVVSFGIECGDPRFPGVYTRVSHNMQWIHDNTDLGRK